MRYVIPMAADTDLFPRSEFHYPKPLIEICGRPLIEHVVNNIRQYDSDAEFIFIVKKSDCDQFSLDVLLEIASEGRCQIIKLSKPTKGSLCSCIMAIEHINDDLPLVICNGDQIIEADISAINQSFISNSFDAAVITFPSVHPRWSFIRLDGDNRVIEAAEKRVLSRNAIAGYYYFKKGLI